MLKPLLIVGAGSFIGGAMRYLLSTFMKNICGQGFPWGTLAVNLLGCFLFGIVFAIFSKNSSADNTLYLLLTTGGFTTFSTFANESVQMLQHGNISGFIGYVAISIIAGFALIALGYLIVKAV